MDLERLIGGCDENAVPQEIAPIVQALIEGRIKQLVLIAEMEDGRFMDAFPILDDSAHRFGMVGAMECVRRDYMRSQIESRVSYVESEGGD